MVCFETVLTRGAAFGISQFLIGLFVIRGYRRKCMKSGHKGSVKADRLPRKTLEDFSIVVLEREQNVVS
ncbi:unnamed protein product [Lactuca virosa]|uniref:Uncharacterized protein n=1 Tax=Lactuca virosa TaxID=75947 RepID=A0AAU9LPJ3_9ASTR|nr:unnamed protein product [Lactuca virosa]